MTITAKALFQSSPAPSHHAAPPRHRSFNPHLHRGAGAACYRQERRDAVEVSILTRTEVRVLQFGQDMLYQAIVFQSSPAPRCGCCSNAVLLTLSQLLFQSSPAPRCGCCSTTTTRQCRRWSFNPHPHRGTGAACYTDEVFKIKYEVSILTRTEVRVLQLGKGLVLSAAQFQSSPAPRYGCCFLSFVDGDSRISFNPHPHRGTGAATAGFKPILRGKVFQSSPAPRYGCCVLGHY